MSRQEFIERDINALTGETSAYFGRDNVKEPIAVPNYTNMYVGDQPM